MTFIYSALENIEPIPQKFIDLALDPEYDKNLPRFGYFSSTFSQAYLERSVTVNDESYVTRYQRKYDLGHEFQLWCKENLHPDCFHAGVAYNQGSGPYHGPHTDKGRKYALYYLLKSGGDNVTTSFWKHPNMSSEPTEDEFPDYACDYSGLQLLDSVVFQPNQWYLFNTGLIHSVENVSEQSRISLQASLADNVDISNILVKNSNYQ
jgi:hypothetical protein